MNKTLLFIQRISDERILCIKNPDDDREIVTDIIPGWFPYYAIPESYGLYAIDEEEFWEGGYYDSVSQEKLLPTIIFGAIGEIYEDGELRCLELAPEDTTIEPPTMLQ